jgi:hypothetical protein
MFMLLQVLQPELEGPSDGEDIPGLDGQKSNANAERITAVTRRVLPALRHYSTWFVSRAEIIEAHVGNASLKVHIKELWKMYADTLSLLVSAFPPEILPEIDYLLEEDAATVDFRPFRDPELAPKCNLYVRGEQLKPRTTDQGISRNHPNVEMLARVRDLLTDGVELTTDPRFPIEVSAGRFSYTEEGFPPTSPILNGHTAQNPVTGPEIALAQHGNGHPHMPERVSILREDLDARSVAASDSHQSMNTDMHRMVDDLVNAPSVRSSSTNPFVNETSYGMNSATAQEAFAIPLSGRPISNRQGTALLSDSSSIWSSGLPQSYNANSNPMHQQRSRIGHERTGTNPYALPRDQNPTAFGLNPATAGLGGHSSLLPKARTDQADVNAMLHAQLLAQFSPRPSAAMMNRASASGSGSGSTHGYTNGYPKANPPTNPNSDITQSSSPWHSTDLFASTPYVSGQPFVGAQAPMHGHGIYGPNGTAALQHGNHNDMQSSYDRAAMLQSSLNHSQNSYGWGNGVTPPGGQGG